MCNAPKPLLSLRKLLQWRLRPSSSADSSFTGCSTIFIYLYGRSMHSIFLLVLALSYIVKNILIIYHKDPSAWYVIPPYIIWYGMYYTTPVCDLVPYWITDIWYAISYYIKMHIDIVIGWCQDSEPYPLMLCCIIHCQISATSREIDKQHLEMVTSLPFLNQAVLHHWGCFLTLDWICQ